MQKINLPIHLTSCVFVEGTSKEIPSGWHLDVDGILVLHCMLITQKPLKKQETGKNGKWHLQVPFAPGHVEEV